MAPKNKKVASSYKEFEAEWKVIREIGLKAFEEGYQGLVKNKSQGDEKALMNLVRKVTHRPDINARLNNAFVIDLEQARQIRASRHIPRVTEAQPDVTEDSRITNNMREREVPSWTDKLDLAADVQDTIRNIIANADDPQNPAMTTQFDDIMNKFKNKLQNEYRHRLTAAPSPRPGNKPRLER